jgi:hypothetical protein
MSENKRILKSRFDTKRARHIANGQTLVLHCHHFASLITQLANDCTMLDGKKLLADCSEDTFYKVLTDYYTQNNVTGLTERIEIAEQYYGEAGLGKLVVKCAGSCAGEVEMLHSHVDEGWIKKWGKSTTPVNHIGCGYVTALFSAVFNKPVRTYVALEHQSMVSGAKTSVITVTDTKN